MPFEDASNDHDLRLPERAGALVCGSTWYTNNGDAWTAVAVDPAASPREHRIAELVTTVDSVVISDSLRIDPEAPWASTTRVVPRAAAPAELARLEQEAGGDLLVFGSATTWNPLLAQGLVDELVILVGAVLLGEGSALYRGPRAGLRRLGARVLEGSELVELRYDASGVSG